MCIELMYPVWCMFLIVCVLYTFLPVVWCKGWCVHWTFFFCWLCVSECTIAYIFHLVVWCKGWCVHCTHFFCWLCVSECTIAYIFHLVVGCTWVTHWANVFWWWAWTGPWSPRSDMRNKARYRNTYECMATYILAFISISLIKNLKVFILSFLFI